MQLHHLIGSLIAVAFLSVLVAFLYVFVRIALAKNVVPAPPAEAAELEALVEHGFAMSEIGMAWAELSRCPGLELKDEWGAGRLAISIRKRDEEHDSEIKLAAAAAFNAGAARAGQHQKGERDATILQIITALRASRSSRAGGGVADAAQGQGSTLKG